MKKCPKCGQGYDDSWKVCLSCSVNLSDDLSIKESNPELHRKSEEKSSRVVTIFGVLIIIGSVLSLLNAQENWKSNHIISNYLYLIILPLSIIAAVFLLKLKNWARIAIIVISTIVLAETLITTPYVLPKLTEYGISKIERSFYEGLEAGKKYKKPDAPEMTKQRVEEAKQKAMVVARKGMQAALIIMIMISVVFNCLVIYFFTRPKVKEQFNQPKGGRL